MSRSKFFLELLNFELDNLKTNKGDTIELTYQNGDFQCYAVAEEYTVDGHTHELFSEALFNSFADRQGQDLSVRFIDQHGFTCFACDLFLGNI